MQEIPFTFGIITDASRGVTQELVNSVCTIRELHIPNHEIIIVGNAEQIRKHQYLDFKYPNLTVIDFNESIREKWITRKKNLITAVAKYENIVYQHDYILYNKDWYEGYKKFGSNFSVCMNKIINHDERRFRDWVLWLDLPVVDALKQIGAGTHDCLIPYEETSLNKYQYISGGYWVAKKKVMKRFPLDETLSWGQGEDIRWSQQVRASCEISMNPFSTVHVGKPNLHRVFEPISEKHLIKLKKILGV